MRQAVLIPGAMPFKQINPLYPLVAATYPTIGEHFHSDGDAQLVVYSQDPLDSNTALAQGVAQTVEVVEGTDGKVVIIGESMGSMVAWRAAAQLAEADPTRDIEVVLIASPDVGISEYFKEGTYIPILNYRVSRVAQTPYKTTIVVGEYDGWSDPPDRPWNLVSSANAMLGIAYVHGPPSFTANVEDLTPVSENGNVTTYLLPTENLPLTQVFRDVGVPDALVDKADEVLRPIVDAGYVRNDKPGDTRPYLYDGEIHRNVQSQQLARESSQPLDDNGPDVRQQRREHRSELRQAIRSVGKDLRDRVEANVSRLEKRIASFRSEPEPGT
ncbi:MAG TPA: PE-PPE domain-containing protein [Mycobacterium sp.]|nr:PE-PPE domain-containing protein [Mycobacterium sp.]